jgi:hypothetical protein
MATRWLGSSARCSPGDPPAVAVDLTPGEFEAFVRLWCPRAAAEGLTAVARDRVDRVTRS